MRSVVHLQRRSFRQEKGKMERRKRKGQLGSSLATNRRVDLGGELTGSKCSVVSLSRPEASPSSHSKIANWTPSPSNCPMSDGGVSLSGCRLSRAGGELRDLPRAPLDRFMPTCRVRVSCRRHGQASVFRLSFEHFPGSGDVISGVSGNHREPFELRPFVELNALHFPGTYMSCHSKGGTWPTLARPCHDRTSQQHSVKPQPISYYPRRGGILFPPPGPSLAPVIECPSA